MKITVEDYHIKSGFPSGCNCPVALAITPRLPAGESVAINGSEKEGYDGAIFSGKEFRRRFKLPLEVQDKIRRYDATGSMEPFEFELDLK